MKKVLFPLLLLAFASTFYAFRTIDSTPVEETIKWYTWEEAVELNKENPKKIVVDLYTDWCGWCKVMDKKTFSNAAVAAYINENFYPVKFNAEQKEDIQFNDHTFKFIAQGRRGVHELAYTLLDGRLGYPSIVYLNEKYERVTISPGFKDADKMMKELKFIAEEIYSEKSWEAYLNGEE
ncbi:MAG: DUF255 domain-containing protein [Bacteroidota bacterium]